MEKLPTIKVVCHLSRVDVWTVSQRALAFGKARIMEDAQLLLEAAAANNFLAGEMLAIRCRDVSLALDIIVAAVHSGTYEGAALWDYERRAFRVLVDAGQLLFGETFRMVAASQEELEADEERLVRYESDNVLRAAEKIIRRKGTR